MFSIIIPLYNKAEYVVKTVDSILNQTFSEFELIIVNDGSTDNSLSVVSTFTDSRIRILTQQNAGVSTARNNGVKNAKFDWVAFCDADDWWHHDFLKEIRLLIQKYPDAGLYASNYKQVINGKEVSKVKIPNFEDGYINYFELLLTKNNPVHSSSVCIKKQYFLEENGFKDYLTMSEDRELWLRMACKYRFAYVNKCLSFYNRDVNPENCLTAKFIPNKENFWIFYLDELELYAKENDSLNDSLKKLLDQERLHVLFVYYRRRMYQQEIKQLLKQVKKSNFSLLWKIKYMCPLLYSIYRKMKVLLKL
jgi:glycosyltransferase involved in cell wall biosynthesis